MLETIILLVTTLLFGKMIYWMYENRNNLGEKTKELFYDLSGILVILGVIAGCIWLIVDFVCEHALFCLILFLFWINMSIDDPPPPRKRRFTEELEKGCYEMDLSRKENERENILREIEDLERERDRIPTYNGFLGGSDLSESEIQYNRDRRDELDREIRDKEWELRELDREIEDKRRNL